MHCLRMKSYFPGFFSFFHDILQNLKKYKIFPWLEKLLSFFKVFQVLWESRRLLENLGKWQQVFQSYHGILEFCQISWRGEGEWQLNPFDTEPMAKIPVKISIMRVVKLMSSPGNDFMSWQKCQQLLFGGQSGDLPLNLHWFTWLPPGGC